MKNKLIMFFLGMGFLLIILLFVLYYYLGIGFGQATIKTIEGVKNANDEWVSNEVNPLDSLKNQTLELIDTTRQE